VSWSADNNKWAAHYTKRGVVTLIGFYDKEKDAARKYDEKARLYLRSGVPLNFPTTGEAPDKSASSGSSLKTAQAKRVVLMPAPVSSGPARRGGESSQEGLVRFLRQSRCSKPRHPPRRSVQLASRMGVVLILACGLAVQVPEARRRRGPAAVGRDPRPPHQAPRQTRARQPG
jgi:hypothetical protein